jgi:hypothetical protein
MDNLTYRLPLISFDVPTLEACLESRGIYVTPRTHPKTRHKLLLFSLKIGKHRVLRLYRINLTLGTISCSGGVTTLFFGHNVWVYKRELVQIKTLIMLEAAELGKIDGIVLPASPESVATVLRVEITRHHALPADVTPFAAIDAVNLMLMAMHPNSRFRNGDSFDDPGVTGLGRNKSARRCRVYDPASKFDKKPSHISDESWHALKVACHQHLRVEIMFGYRELLAAGLSTVAAWENAAKLEQMMTKRYAKYGLCVRFKADKAGMSPSEVAATNPRFVEPARHWFTAGARGTPLNARSGTYGRFRNFMAAHGYRIAVPFAWHGYLRHGLHDALQSESSAELPPELRDSAELFGRWWLNASD